MPTPLFMKKYVQLQQAKRLKLADPSFVLAAKEAEAERKAKEEEAELNSKEGHDAKRPGWVEQCVIDAWREIQAQWLHELSCQASAGGGNTRVERG